MGSMECARFPRYAIMSLCCVSLRPAGCSRRRSINEWMRYSPILQWINRLCVVVNISVSQDEEFQA